MLDTASATPKPSNDNKKSTMDIAAIRSILFCYLLFAEYCYAESIPPITSVSVPPLSTSKSEKDWISFLEHLTYNLMDKSYDVEPTAIATPPSDTHSLHYCTHLYDCPELSAAIPSDVGTIIGPDYLPEYDLQQLIDDAKAITKEVAITTHFTTHTATSNPSVVTVTAPHGPFTSTQSDWNVVECEKSTVILGMDFNYHTTSCLPPSTTITSLKPTVSIRMDATPCNWGTMSSTDIYTSVSSALMDACSASPVPTQVLRVPKDINGINPKDAWAPRNFTTTMSACNPKTMTIHDVYGPIQKQGDDRDASWEKMKGEVLVVANANYFEPAYLEDLVNASARFVATAASRNPKQFLFRIQENNVFGEELTYQNETMYSANSSELNWYDPGFTEYTQAFIVQYTWIEAVEHGNAVCETVDIVAGLLVEAVPELAEIAEIAVFLCEALSKS